MDLMNTIRDMGWNILHRVGLADVIDILIVAVLIYEMLLMLRHTRGSTLLKGLMLFVVIAVASNLLGFTSLNWIMMTILSNGAIVLVILFQPELRRALESMGSSSIFEGKRRKKDAARGNSRERIMNEIVQCMLDLSKRRVGLLIVFERSTGLQDIINTGTAVDAEISAPLLENIFEPNTPLHDGAVVIRGDRVAAAACILNLTEASGVSRELGTRHRAAIGISENTDAIVFVVSEETGTMSLAQNGELRRPMTGDSLREALEKIFSDDTNVFREIYSRLFKGKEGRK